MVAGVSKDVVVRAIPYSSSVTRWETEDHGENLYDSNVEKLKLELLFSLATDASIDCIDDVSTDNPLIVLLMMFSLVIHWL